MPSLCRRARVLLIEDSEDDTFFFDWAVHKCRAECDLTHVANGEDAIKHLMAMRLGRMPPPDIVFVDLKVPTRDGFEILAWLREHPFSPPLPAIVLSGSEHANDLERARRLGASAYYVKPISPPQLRAILDDGEGSDDLLARACAPSAS